MGRLLQPQRGADEGKKALVAVETIKICSMISLLLP